MSNEITIVLNDDGTVSINATKMKGSEAAILKELETLAKSIGGDLKVEKHVHGAHGTHTHGVHTHSHN